MSRSGSGFLRNSAGALLVVAVDQAAKGLARALLAPGETISVIPGLFGFTLVFNDGAAWGMMAGFRYGFIVLAVAMLAVIAAHHRQIFGPGRLGAVSSALLSGGIVGNLVDRLLMGRVTDFLHFWHGSWHFPCFNVADSAICIGVALLLFASVDTGDGAAADANG